MSVPLQRGRGASSSPLLDIQIFRPGPALALIILLTPAVVALAGAAVYLNVDGTIPSWLPFTLLLWIPCMPALWFAMQSVRTDSTGLAAGRPWRRWEEVRWEDIERVEARGPLLRVVGAQGQRITFSTALLRDGDRLRRQLLLRLPAHVLAGRLSHEAQQLVVTDIYSTPEGGYAGTLATKTRPPWRIALALIAAAAIAGAVAALMSAPLTAGTVGLATVCVAIALGAGWALVWASRTVLIDAEGIAVVTAILRRKYSLKWSEIELVEHTSRQRALRLRGNTRLVCPGPGLLTPAQATLMRGLLYEYCAKRRVPILRRVWVM
jgi:hypothetical protein